LLDWCVEAMRQKNELAMDSELSERKANLLAMGASQKEVDAETKTLQASIRNSHRFSEEWRHLAVNLKDGGKVEGKSFSELATVARVHQEVPAGFAFKAVYGRTTVEVVMKAWGNRTLEIAASGEDLVFVEEVFGKLQGWASDIRPSRWLQLWLDNASFAGFLIYMWCMSSILLFGLISAPHPGPSIVRQQAWTMAKQGVTQANQAKALELLLSIQSGYEPASAPTVQHFPGLQFYAYFAVGLFVLIAFRIPPRGAIGIWGGKRSLERQRQWVQFVTVSVPGFVLSAAILPMIARLLGWSK